MCLLKILVGDEKEVDDATLLVLLDENEEKDTK